ncbi:hypothetical protein GPL15_16650 [Clostridium sp. MCC353]|uniref:SWIM zinc finger family protein n=1 Tax=Clostridium sp. MCC353 TaxID=2592646 RepID=UPI001C03A1FF|nr:hypothetical protein [Clostridium sp. MCC353]MBT9778132.1 hypothetical protein [Clostridium sp. MCC353]
MIRLGDIRKITEVTIYEEGEQIYKTGSVSDLKALLKDDTEYHISSVVKEAEGKGYRTEISYNAKNREISSYHCECQAYGSSNGMCRHCAASALAFKKWWEENVDRAHEDVDMEEISRVITRYKARKGRRTGRCGR